MQQEVFTGGNKCKDRRKSGSYAAVIMAILLIMALALTACGSDAGGKKEDAEPANGQAAGQESDKGAGDTDSPAASTEQTRTVKHEYGESIVPSQPKRVLSIGMEDILLSLDVPLVQAFSTDGYYLDKPIKEKGIAINSAFDINLEAITAADPDLIIMNKYMTDEQGYEQLSKIAPTIAYIRDDWQSSLTEIGKALGMESQADNILHAYQDKVEQAKETIIKAVGENKTVAFIRPSVKDVELDFPDWSWVSLLYGDLGLKPDPKVLEFQKNSSDTWGGTMLSLEKLPELTADYLFLDYGSSMSNEDEFQKDVAQSAEVEKMNVWKAIPAVKRGDVHKVSARNWALSGPIADSMKIDDVVQALVGK